MKIQSKLKLDALTLSKLSFFVFTLYVFWFRYAYGMQQILFYASAVLIALFVGLDILLRKQIFLKAIPLTVKMYFALTFYALMSGVFVSQNKTSLISAVLTFFAHSVICFSVAYISEVEGSIAWVRTILIICGLVCAFYIYFRGDAHLTSGVVAITLGPEHNANYSGTCMLTVIFALLYDFERFQKHLIFNSLLLLIFVGVVFLSASRTSFIGLSILLVGSIIRYAVAIRKKELSKIPLASSRLKGDYLATAILLIGIGLGLFYMLNQFEGSAVYEKFVLALTEGEGVGSRQLLFREAWEVFLKHPFFGVGLDQFRAYSSTNMYSHSIYSETLSCLGIFGTLIFFVPLLVTYFQMFSRLMHRKLQHSIAFMILLMFTVELVIGIGHIYLYSFHSLLVLAMISWIWEHENQTTLPLTDPQEEVSNA